MRSGIGDTLRAARRAHGRTLSDAAQATRVRERYLAALEQEDFSVLGGDVYARGFLRSYARFLGLDPEPLVEAYEARLSDADSRLRGRPARRRPAGADRAHRPAAHARPAGRADAAGEPARQPQPPQERPPGAAVLLVLVVVVLLVVAFVGLRGDASGAEVAPVGLGAGAAGEAVR